MPAWKQPGAMARAWRSTSLRPGIASVSSTRPDQALRPRQAGPQHRADAALICDDCRLFEPAAWTPPTAALRELRDRVRTREALTASRVECGAARVRGARRPTPPWPR